MKRLKAAASSHKARVPGSTNQPLVLEKVSRNKVEVAWPLPVSADTCARFLKLALGDNWRDFVTGPAGVQGAHQEAGTAEEGVVAAEAAGEEVADLLSGAEGEQTSSEGARLAEEVLRTFEIANKRIL